MGHAIECRINAEDPVPRVPPLPRTGRCASVLPGGPGVRVDTHVYQGYSIPPTYDSLVAKLIVWGATIARRPWPALSARLPSSKSRASRRRSRSIGAALCNDAFRSGEVYTDFIETHMPEFLK